MSTDSTTSSPAESEESLPQSPSTKKSSSARQRMASNPRKNHQINKETSRYQAHMAVSQIEWLFSVDNLCQDTYLRSFMDSEGYVPISYVCNFLMLAGYRSQSRHAVRATSQRDSRFLLSPPCRLGASYPEILKAISESQTLEVDEANETVRPKENPQKWVFPTPAPRWIKLASPQQPNQYQRRPKISQQGQHQRRGTTSSSLSPCRALLTNQPPARA
jgi:hypothetical protein